MNRLLPALLLLIPFAGCHTVVEAPAGEVDRQAIYQEIADALPEADFGWGAPSAIAEMSASAKSEGPVAGPAALKASEKGFRIRFQVYRPKTVWVPYEAIQEVSTSWKAVPNVFFIPFIVLPLQAVRATVVFDANQVSGLITGLKADIKRLEAISREIGMGGPWSHAQTVKWKIEDDAVAYGSGMLAVHFDFLAGAPAWFPVGGRALRVAEAFAWVKEHPDEPELDPAETPKGDDTEPAASRPGG